MQHVSPVAMESGSGIDHFQEPVHEHGQRQDSNAATSPSDSDGAPTAAAAQGGADASSPSPLPAAPVDRSQERAREQAGVGGSRGTNGSGSATVGVNLEDKGSADISSLAPSASSSAGSSPRTPSRDSACPFGDVDCKELFDQMVREAGGDKKKKKKPEEEQVKPSRPKKAFWSKVKNLFTRQDKIVDREEWHMYPRHVGRQTIPIADHYSATEEIPIRVDLDAYSRIRPVLGDGECFYRSFIFSYLEQVLDREDTHEEHRLLDTLERVSTEHTNLGWTSEFCRSYEAFKKLIKKVMEWKRQGTLASSANRFLICYRKERLLEFFSSYGTTNDIFVFLRLVVAIQICSHSDQYGEIIPGLGEGYSLKDWCFHNVTSPREFTDHVMMTALATALEIPLRLERLYGGGSAEDNIYTGPGAVSVTLLYTGNHYDIIYPHAPCAESSSRQAPCAESSSRQASQRERPAA